MIENEQKFLELIDIHTSFGAVKALDGVSLSIVKGEVICIVGPSGCGKSTLLRTVNWLTPPTKGRVCLDKQVIAEATTEGLTRKQLRALDKFRSKIGMVFQQFNVWPHLTVVDNVSKAQMIVLNRSKADAEERALVALKSVGLLEKAYEWPENLSGGQKQRLSIARALAMGPSLMLLDEPTSALDPELVVEVLNVLKNLALEGMTMIIVTHELGFAKQVANRVLFMENGRIVEDGPPQQILNKPKTNRLKTFLKRLDLTGTGVKSKVAG